MLARATRLHGTHMDLWYRIGLALRCNAESVADSQWLFSTRSENVLRWCKCGDDRLCRGPDGEHRRREDALEPAGGGDIRVAVGGDRLFVRQHHLNTREAASFSKTPSGQKTLYRKEHERLTKEAQCDEVVGW